jgi:hypothetical protein
LRIYWRSMLAHKGFGFRGPNADSEQLKPPTIRGRGVVPK